MNGLHVIAISVALINHNFVFLSFSLDIINYMTTVALRRKHTIKLAYIFKTLAFQIRIAYDDVASIYTFKGVQRARFVFPQISTQCPVSIWPCYILSI